MENAGQRLALPVEAQAAQKKRNSLQRKGRGEKVNYKNKLVVVDAVQKSVTFAPLLEDACEKKSI